MSDQTDLRIRELAMLVLFVMLLPGAYDILAQKRHLGTYAPVPAVAPAVVMAAASPVTQQAPVRVIPAPPPRDTSLDLVMAETVGFTKGVYAGWASFAVFLFVVLALNAWRRQREGEPSPQTSTLPTSRWLGDA